MIKKISRRLKDKNIYHKTEGDFILTRKSKIKIPLINKDIAYLIGVIAGDGSLSKTKRKKGGFHYIIRIYSNSESFLEKINQIFLKHFEIEGRINKDKRKKQTYFLTIQNAIIYEYLSNLEAKYDFKNKVPNFCEYRNYLNYYLAGLIDTDGSVYGKRIQLKLKNKLVIGDIFSKVKHANPNPPKINYTKNIPFYYIRFDNIFPLRWKIENQQTF